MDVSVKSLSCARGGVPLLEGVDFHVPSGRALILTGPNGTGKTTLLRTLVGLQPAVGGEIVPGPEVMAYAAHADALKGTLSVAENLGFWASMFGQTDVAPAVETYGLGPLMDRPALQLSAGQRRRAGLARLMVTGRPVWILDEPTVSLDRDRIAMFASAVQEHLATGGSAIIATHADIGFEAPKLDLAQFRPDPAVAEITGENWE